jgi:hypothetical protein
MAEDEGDRGRSRATGTDQCVELEGPEAAPAGISIKEATPASATEIATYPKTGSLMWLSTLALYRLGVNMTDRCCRPITSGDSVLRACGSKKDVSSINPTFPSSRSIRARPQLVRRARWRRCTANSSSRGPVLRGQAGLVNTAPRGGGRCFNGPTV